MTVDNWLALANIFAVALVGLIAIWNGRKLNTVSINLNGRLSELLQLTAKSSHAEGVEQQKAADDHPG